MICQDCRNGYHEGCPKGTWCDCQHRVPVKDLPPEILDAIERLSADPGSGIRRERPQRKTLVELVTDGKLTTEAQVREAALVELTQMMQDMGLDDHEAALKVATEGGTVENL